MYPTPRLCGASLVGANRTNGQGETKSATDRRKKSRSAATSLGATGMRSSLKLLSAPIISASTSLSNPGSCSGAFLSPLNQRLPGGANLGRQAKFRPDLGEQNPIHRASDITAAPFRQQQRIGEEALTSKRQVEDRVWIAPAHC